MFFDCKQLGKYQMKTIYLLIYLIVMGLTACIHTKEQPTVELVKPAAAQLSVGDSSRTSLDWSGVYEGLLPCSNCEGIKLRLQLNSDNSYQFIQNYLGQTDTGERNTPEVQIGHFKWNTRGSHITLDTNEPPMLFQVGENQLFILNSDATRISNELANRYRLLKVQ